MVLQILPGLFVVVPIRLILEVDIRVQLVVFYTVQNLAALRLNLDLVLCLIRALLVVAILGVCRLLLLLCSFTVLCADHGVGIDGAVEILLNQRMVYRLLGLHVRFEELLRVVS